MHLLFKFGDRRSLTCTDNAYKLTSIFYDDKNPVEWVRVTWLLVCDQGSLLGLSMQDYKYLCAAVIRFVPSLVSVQTDIHRDTQIQMDEQHLTSLYDKLRQLS